MKEGLKLTFPYKKILCHPNIPKPLHGLNPRTINGDSWWNHIRQKVYAKYDYHCLACGIHKSEAKKHQWLEAHENWEINYSKGECKVDSIQPLCHYCHQFIHSGFLSVRKDIYNSEKRLILQHGFDTLKGSGLKVFKGTWKLAKRLNVKRHDLRPQITEMINVADWNEWYLLYNGKKYYSLYKDYADWINRYS